MSIGSMKVSDFLRSIPGRTDGKIFIASVVVCGIFYAINAIDAMTNFAGINPNAGWIGKWKSIWGIAPIILLAMHIRSRIISKNEYQSIFSLIMQALHNSILILFLALFNWGLI